MRLQMLAPLACLWVSQGLADPLLAQTQSLSQGTNRIEIQLERKDADTWRAVDPGLVFLQQELIRFKVKLNFSGYLYVLNHGTSGEYTLLFPRAETGQENKVEPNCDYIVPATEGSFRITGPAGQEIVYWLVSPLELQAEDVKSKYVPLPSPPKEKKVPPKLIPRCDETIFRARGDCVDPTAGAQGVVEGENLPDNLASISTTGARELNFIRDQDSSLVSAPDTMTKPVIFEFRLAHR